MWSLLSRCKDKGVQTLSDKQVRVDDVAITWQSRSIQAAQLARVHSCPIVPHTLPIHRPILLHASLLPASHGRRQHAEPAEIGPHVYEEGLTARRAVTLALEDLVEDLSMYAIKVDHAGV